MNDIEQTCSKCGTLNIVPKSYSCTSCSTWNKFVIIEEETSVKDTKRGKKKWLS